MRKKRITSYALFMVVIILVSMITGCTTSVEKIPIPKIEKDVYIYDDDNIIDDDVEKKLNKMLVELEEKTEAEFAVVSVKSLLDRSIEDYANNLFNTLGIGKKGKDFFVRVKVERHREVLFFPESVDDFGCFPAGDGDESEGGLVFQFIPHAVNLREFPLAIATGGNEENQQGCVSR